MSSCVMKMSKVALALAILFSVSSDNGSLCEALLLSKLKQKRVMCADGRGNSVNCDDFVSSKNLKGHIYRLKNGTEGRTAFDNSYCVKNKVPGFADGVKAALGELNKSIIGTEQQANVGNGEKMFNEVIKAVKMAYDSYTDAEAQELTVLPRNLWIVTAATDIDRIASGIDRDLSSVYQRSKKEAIEACRYVALTALKDGATLESDAEIVNIAFFGAREYPFNFENSYCVTNKVTGFEVGMRRALYKILAKKSSFSPSDVENIFNEIIQSVEDTSSTPAEKTKNAIAAASDIDLIVERIEKDPNQNIFFQNKMCSETLQFGSERKTFVLDNFRRAARLYLERKVGGGEYSLTWEEINAEDTGLREFYSDSSSSIFFNKFVKDIVREHPGKLHAEKIIEARTHREMEGWIKTTPKY